MTTTLFAPETRSGIVPRDYQTDAHDGTFRLWNDGVVGALVRAATGTGKTLMGSLIADTWLRRGDDYRVMVVSYERQLVWQFAEEIYDYIGITPGIEMDTERATASHRVVVASRASLLYAPRPTKQQIETLAGYGINDLGAAPKRLADSLIKQLGKGAEPESVRDYLAEMLNAPEANERGWSRVHRFDWQLNWLLIFDEAHRHSHHLQSVGPLIDWFGQNPLHRRMGLTATPKRADGVSIGEVMFPGIALDYPLIGSGRCALRDGYAVPYVQRYIVVEGVNFKAPEFLDPSSESGFDDVAVAAELEKHLAGLVMPTLELADRRRTLIFSGTVALAKQVAAFINARRRYACECGRWKWYKRGEPEACECGLMPVMESDTEQAREVDGESPPEERKRVYDAHQSGQFQCLSVCGLCIAKGSRIMTDSGEVPIESVTTAMKVWDGIEFVAHDGVIAKGIRPVIEYAGLKATGDHNVWTASGWKTLAQCQQSGTAIAVGAIGGCPVRESDGYYRHGVCERQPAALRSQVCRLRQYLGAAVLSLASGSVGMPRLRGAASPAKPPDAWLPAEREGGSLLQAARGHVWGGRSRRHPVACWCRGPVHRLRQKIHQVVGRIAKWAGGLQKLLKNIRHPPMVAISVPGRQAAMYEPALPGLLRLWWARHQDGVRHGASDGPLDNEQPRSQKMVDAGPDRQQRELCPWELAVRDEYCTGQQPTAEAVYDILNAGPRHRFTANGLIVSNCREGYNDPDIACIAIYRLVSKKASSLAEQMKGRGCRPLRVLAKRLHEYPGAEARCQAIAESSKPNCLIIDLVGVTGLADCASTVQIYAEGKPAKIIERAEELTLEGMEIEEAIEQAETEEREAEERVRVERQEAERQAKAEAERRAKAKAEVTYSVHDVGFGSADPKDASDGQWKFLKRLGLRITGWIPTKKQAGRMIDQLLHRVPVDEVARTNRIPDECWSFEPASEKQRRFMDWKHVPNTDTTTGYEASLLIDAKLNPADFERNIGASMAKATNHAALDVVRHDMTLVRGVLPADVWNRLAQVGKARREYIAGYESPPVEPVKPTAESELDQHVLDMLGMEP